MTTLDDLLVAPVFIVGAGRSGTTLVRTLLSAHPSLAITPETHYWRFAERHGALEGDTVPDPRAFLAALEGYRRFKDVDVDMRDVEDLLPDIERPRFSEIFAALLVAYGRKHAKPRAGEKSPGHYRVIGRLLEHYPDARMIYVVRDPRAVAASALDAPWVLNKLNAVDSPRYSLLRSRFFQIASQARGWTRIYGQVLPRWQRHPRVITVRYEALVSDPDGETGRICRFLEEDWTPDMLSGRASVEGAAAGGGFHAWTAKHEARAGAPITDEGTQRWRSSLSAREVAVIDGICRRPMRELGYELQASSLARIGAGLLADIEWRAHGLEKWLRRRIDAPPAR